MRVLITGAGGQLGQALKRLAPQDVETRFATRSDLNIEDAVQVRQYVGEMAPDLIINAAAYTAVDKAEGDEAAALRANSHAPRALAEAALAGSNTRLIHVSTDFVFDGEANIPYQPGDPIAPINVYGRSKAGGETAVLDTLGDRTVVVRTAWVYSAVGHNFLRTMLRLLNERVEVSVVDDQIGTPTSALSLAAALWRFAPRPDLSGVFHWTDAGVASWYDFAVAIAEEGKAAGLLSKEGVVRPIGAHSYPTPARRPKYSVLDKRSTLAALGIESIHWRKQLRSVLQGLIT